MAAVVPASGRLLVILTAELNGLATTNSTAFMSVSLDNSIALDTNSLRVTGDDPVRASVTVLITSLTPGSDHLHAPCTSRSVAGTATFNARQIIVIPA